MADADIQITAGTGTKVDTRTVGAGTDEHRQVVVVGDPSTAAAVAPVTAADGLLVNLGTNNDVAGDVAHDSPDSGGGGPVKIGGKALTAAPTPVAANDRVNAWFDEYGRIVTSDFDVEINNTIGATGLRDRLFAQRCTVLADSLADGLAGFWTSTTANGGTATSSGGEGLIQTSANATGSAQITSTTQSYFPGQVAWFNSAVRFNDTGSAGNTRRIGVFTVSGTTPQDGFYFELSGTTLNAVVVLSGTPSATASASWSRAAVAPFTLDTSYHSFEIRYTSNTVWFYVDNVLRHQVSGTTAAITATLNFPMTIQSINASGASNRLIAVRNCGMGRFGNPEQGFIETGLSALNTLAVGGGTPHDSVDSGHPQKIGGKALSTQPTLVADNDRVNAWFDLNGALNIIATRKQVRIAVTSGGLTTSASAYVGADQVGTQFTFAGAARVSGGTGRIKRISLISAADTIGAMDLVVFDSSVTLASDNAAFAISDADALKFVEIIPLAGAFDIGNNRVCTSGPVDIAYTCSGGTSLYGGLITRAGIAATPFANATDIQLVMYVELD